MFRSWGIGFGFRPRICDLGFRVFGAIFDFAVYIILNLKQDLHRMPDTCLAIVDTGSKETFVLPHRD